MNNTGREQISIHDGGLGMDRLAVAARPLDRLEALELLASVDYGRVVFSLNALPAIRPVNHLLDNHRIIIRTRLTSAFAQALTVADRVVVAYEADHIDPVTHAGWCTVITGRAHAVPDPAQIAYYEDRLQPWVNHADTVVAIEPEIITGFGINATINSPPGS